MSKGQASKKDKHYSKIIRLKEKEISSLSDQLVLSKSEESSQEKTIEYLKVKLSDLDGDIAKVRQEKAELATNLKRI